MQIETLIKNGLKRNTDYSDSFTKFVASINKLLGNNLSVKCYHSSDMNYSHGQSVSFFLDSNFDTIEREQFASYTVKIWISSKGKFYSIIFFKKISNNPLTWKRFEFSDFNQSDKLNNLISEIDMTLKSEGLIRFPIEKEKEKVEGFYTELDNNPANFFEVFFSELD